MRFWFILNDDSELEAFAPLYLSVGDKIIMPQWFLEMLLINERDSSVKETVSAKGTIRAPSRIIRETKKT